MAKAPAVKTEGSADERLECEANDRLEDCRRQKAVWDRDMREAYFFCDPQRHRSVSSRTAPVTTTRNNDEADLQTSIGFEVAQDFATELIAASIPATAPWAARGQGPLIEDAVWAEIKAQVAKEDAKIFKAIKASNFYEAAAQTFYPDASVGTVGMWIDNLRPAEPVVCQPVPLRELEINVGPTGAIDDRFIVRHTKHRFITTLLPKVTLPADLAKRVTDEPNDKCEVRWGFWRDWADMGGVAWHYVVMIGCRVVDSGRLVGSGSCPLMVGRFNPDPMYAFGRGPAIQALPELRVNDEMMALLIESVGFSIKKPFAYPDDSGLNFEDGIEEGMGYPARMGQGFDIKPLYLESDAQFSEFNKQENERRIKRLFFVDKPEQRGDTPPTATQWLDEMMLAQRRLGTPGQTFWREFAAESFMRFKYLLEQRGVVEPIKIDGAAVSLQPVNPAERSANQQKVATASRILQMGAAFFPTETQAGFDGVATMQNVIDALGDDILVKRDEKKAAALIQTLAGASPPDATGAGPTPGAASV